MFTAEQVLDASHAVRPHLAELLGDDAVEFEGELAALIERAEAGEDVTDELLDLLNRHEPVRAFVADILERETNVVAGNGGGEPSSRAMPPSRARPGSDRAVMAEPPPTAAEPPPGVAADSVAAAAPVTRYFEGRANDSVAVGSVLEVMARVAVEAAPGGNTAVFDVVIPPTGLDLVVMLYAPGFTTPPNAMQHVHVPADGDSQWVLYELEARAAGDQTVLVTLFHPEGRQLAQLTMSVHVGDVAAVTSPVTSRAEVPEVSGEEGEITLLIDWLDDLQRYRFQFVSAGTPPEVLTDRLLQTPQSIVSRLVAELDDVARGAQTPANLRNWLRARGVDLWSGLVPDEISSQYWSLRDRVTALRIDATDDVIPWELLYPLAPQHGDDGFLVEQFPVMRSVRGHTTPRAVGRSSIVTVLPGPGAPPSAAAECTAVEQHWPEASRRPQIDNLEALRALLEEGAFGVMHFACHNAHDFSDAARAAIAFDDDRLTPVDLAPAVQLTALAANAPVVFMNACTTAGQAPAYTETSGWAARFIEAGAGGYVGSMWKVRDKTASRFAEAFYDKFVRGETFAQALKAGRDAVKDDNDPTWLAYTGYGDAHATFAGGDQP